MNMHKITQYMCSLILNLGTLKKKSCICTFELILLSQKRLQLLLIQQMEEKLPSMKITRVKERGDIRQVEGVDVPERGGADHVTESGEDGAGLVIEIVTEKGEADLGIEIEIEIEIGIGEIEDGVTDPVPENVLPSPWQTKRERGRRRGRERERITRAAGERSQSGGTLLREDLSTSHLFNIRLCKVHYIIIIQCHF